MSVLTYFMINLLSYLIWIQWTFKMFDWAVKYIHSLMLLQFAQELCNFFL